MHDPPPEEHPVPSTRAEFRALYDAATGGGPDAEARMIGLRRAAAENRELRRWWQDCNNNDPVAKRQGRELSKAVRAILRGARASRQATIGGEVTRRVRRIKAASNSCAPARQGSARTASRPRERRAGSSSRTSSADPGESEPPPPLRALPAPRAILTYGFLPAGECPHCTQPLHTDRNGAEHCGGCGITWWEGAR